MDLYSRVSYSWQPRNSFIFLFFFFLTERSSVWGFLLLFLKCWLSFHFIVAVKTQSFLFFINKLLSHFQNFNWWVKSTATAGSSETTLKRITLALSRLGHSFCQGHVTSLAWAFISWTINNIIRGQISSTKLSPVSFKRQAFSSASLQRPCVFFPEFYIYSTDICDPETHSCHTVLHNYFPFRCNYGIASPATLFCIISHVFSSFDLGLCVVCHKSAERGVGSERTSKHSPHCYRMLLKWHSIIQILQTTG